MVVALARSEALRTWSQLAEEVRVTEPTVHLALRRLNGLGVLVAEPARRGHVYGLDRGYVSASLRTIADRISAEKGLQAPASDCWTVFQSLTLPVPSAVLRALWKAGEPLTPQQLLRVTGASEIMLWRLSTGGVVERHRRGVRFLYGSDPRKVAGTLCAMADWILSAEHPQLARLQELLAQSRHSIQRPRVGELRRAWPLRPAVEDELPFRFWATLGNPACIRILGKLLADPLAEPIKGTAKWDVHPYAHIRTLLFSDIIGRVRRAGPDRNVRFRVKRTALRDGLEKTIRWCGTSRVPIRKGRPMALAPALERLCKVCAALSRGGTAPLLDVLLQSKEALTARDLNRLAGRPQKRSQIVNVALLLSRLAREKMVRVDKKGIHRYFEPRTADIRRVFADVLRLV